MHLPISLTYIFSQVNNRTTNFLFILFLSSDGFPFLSLPLLEDPSSLTQIRTEWAGVELRSITSEDFFPFKDRSVFLVVFVTDKTATSSLPNRKSTNPICDRKDRSPTIHVDAIPVGDEVSSGLDISDRDPYWPSISGSDRRNYVWRAGFIGTLSRQNCLQSEGYLFLIAQDDAMSPHIYFGFAESCALPRSLGQPKEWVWANNNLEWMGWQWQPLT